MKKTVHYRRVVWFDKVKQTLGEMLSDCLEKIQDDVLPTFDVGNSIECLLARRTEIDGEWYLHFVTYERGAPVAVINTSIQANSVEASEQDTEGDNEFIISQLFCLISRNDILWVTHNEPMREGRAQLLISQFIDHCGAGHEFTQFMFQVVLDQAIIDNALQDGIEYIDLSVGSFRPTLEQIVNGGELPKAPFLGGVGKLFRGRATEAAKQAADNLEARLILRPGKSWDKPAVMDLLAGTSKRVMSDYDNEFAIKTKNGIRLTAEKISITRDVSIENGNRRVLASMEVESKMREVLLRLRDDDITDGT